MSKRNHNILGIVIPMYNEEKGAEKCIKKTLEYTQYLPQVKLFIVNDASYDNTAMILNKFSTNSTVQIIHHKKNTGYGGALTTGAKKAFQQGYDYILFMDSDLTNHPKFIKDFYNQIPLGYDCVKASRFIEKGSMEGVPQYRRLFSIFGNFIARLCFQMGIHDYTNGFRMLKSNVLHKIQYKETDFSIILEEMYYLKKMKASCSEIPTILTSRKNTVSHFAYSLPLIFSYGKYAIKALHI